MLSNFEETLIIRLQYYVIGESGDFNTYLFTFLYETIRFSEINTIRYGVYALFLFNDAILATKTGIVSFSGIFILVFLKLTYKEGRPYWNNS